MIPGPARNPIHMTACAKINLALHVVGRRDDGYHLLDMLVGFADFGDEVMWEPGGDCCRLRVRDALKRPHLVPEDTSNLAWQALALAGRYLREPLAGTLTVDKRLPSGAGIGGGSSDAASVLRLLLGDDCFSNETVRGRGLSLGADIPVCLSGRPSRVRGIGERVEPVALGAPLPVVLLWPGAGLSTPAVFKARSGPFSGGIPENAVDHLAVDPLEAIRNLRNDLESPARDLLPAVGDALMALEIADGCRFARMSGSGSCVVGYFATHDAADLAAREIAAQRPEWWVRSALVTR